MTGAGGTHAGLGGQVLVVTGAASGVGEAIALRFAELGATVVAVDIDDAGLDALGARLGPAHATQVLDVGDPQGWADLTDRVVADHGSLDILCLNAGVTTSGAADLGHPVDWLTVESYRRTVGVNTDGVVFGVIAALPHMKRQGAGRIVVTNSGAGLFPFVYDAVYSLSKFATVGFVRALGPPLAVDGISLNVICPVNVDTAMVPENLKVRDEHGAVTNRLSGLALQAPSKIADAVLMMLDAGGAGEVWLAVSGDEPRRVEFPPVPWGDGTSTTIG